MFSAYASMAASMMLLRSMANELIPQPIRGYILNAFHYLVKPRSQSLTLVIEESNGIARNHVYDAAEAYLSTRVSPDNERLKICKSPKEKKLTIRLEKGEKLLDLYDGVSLRWRFICAESDKNAPSENTSISSNVSVRSEKRYFELSFHKKHKQMVLESYLPFVLEKAKEMKDDERVLKMHTLNTSYCYGGVKWDSINLEHPSTFETLAMDSEQKEAIMGPPGTGKSSLIAAMANYLKFDIYDLQLANIVRDSDLRKLLLATANRSILVIEDIDCSVDLPERRHVDHHHHHGRKQTDVQVMVQLTLSGLLNFIDGLWSSCGDERIIIFTTNHKERLDPALLRPGRMDMHIHMSYCSFQAFKILASNYLDISSDHHHHLFPEIEGLIEDTQITPAHVAEELMKSEDADVALQGFVKLLKRKKMEGDVCENDDPDNKAEPATKQSKKRKVACKQKKTVAAAGTQRRTRRLRRGSSL
ncbi:hypothetical protein Ahy_Scaffold1g106718 isoform E [Arachis hypogaea]|uniref:AAA+ ATPase domain-containing protein n=1 Tax=Arachis hypogaea TaxID=3818 RepID=A0A444WRJ9_ARAHY|nr:hypothetical protein Ahy_Scaffold1g106718 isoform E [Arachis hypogaea]